MLQIFVKLLVTAHRLIAAASAADVGIHKKNLVIIQP